MSNQENSPSAPAPGNNSDLNISRQNAALATDLTDSKHDQERMKPEVVILDLPDVSDIPGQEHVHVPNIMEMQDATIASDDEEGVGVFDIAEEDDLNMGTEADVSATEVELLQRTETSMGSDEDNGIGSASPDTTDNQGEPLNEASLSNSTSGSDLDIPEAVDETKSDALGQGDEENDFYSLGSDSNDNVTEGTP